MAWACTTVFDTAKPIALASGQGYKIGFLTGTATFATYHSTRVILQNAAGRTLTSMFKSVFGVFCTTAATIPCKFEWIPLVGTDSLVNVTGTLKAWRLSTGAEAVDDAVIGATRFIAIGQI